MKFNPTNLPIAQEFPKLIRDRIPEIIKKSTGKNAHIRVAEDDEEYLSFLLRKMIEESIELQRGLEEGNLPEELADISELIDSILEHTEITREEIKHIQEKKQKKNGGFKKRYILLDL